MAASEAVAADLMRRALGERVLCLSVSLSLFPPWVHQCHDFHGARTNYALGKDFSLFSFSDAGIIAPRRQPMPCSYRVQ
jgi:hypothetical protein